MTPLDLRIRDIPIDQIETILPLIEQLNPTTAREVLQSRLSEMAGLNYHCVGAFDGDRLIGVTGYWIGVRLYCGRYVDLDNVIVDEEYRSSGIGKKIVAWIEDRARELGCQVAMLDCYVIKSEAHKFYFREGYSILGFHFIKNLTTGS